MRSMVRGRGWAAWLLAGVLVAAAVSGCEGHRAASAGHQTASRPVASAAPTPASTPTTGTPGQPSGQPSGPVPGADQPGPSTALPARCTGVLTGSDLDIVFGRRVPGRSQAIRGLAEPEIGRTGRITCRYGMTDQHPGPAVEIALSSYVDADAASQRVDFTVHDERAKGATAGATSVSGLAGVLLSTPALVTVVLPYGTFTLAVSVDPRLLVSGAAGQVATRIGATVLRRLHTDDRSAG